MEQGWERKALEARLGDLAAAAERGELAVSAFLTPKEGLVATRYFKTHGISYRMFGGYADAERVRAYVLPSYMEGVDESDLSSLLESFGYESRISCLRVKGSGYASLSHRDFLGSLLGLGLERSIIGDLLVTDGTALVFCDTPIVSFLLEEWRKVGNDAVRISLVEDPSTDIPPRQFATIHDTIASPRLDAVVSALCRLSRDRAKTAVETGLVELDFEREERPDRIVGASSIISVRGYGRYRILSVSEQTKKGRFRLDAQKYL